MKRVKSWEKEDERHHMQSGDTHPVIHAVLHCPSMHSRRRKLVLMWGRKTAAPGNMLTPGNKTTETIPCSMHGVPERRSNERGGWCGVTPCVVPPPYRLPTKRATFTPKYDRLLAPWGCRGERHGWPVRVDVFPLFESFMWTRVGADISIYYSRFQLHFWKQSNNTFKLKSAARTSSCYWSVSLQNESNQWKYDKHYNMTNRHWSGAYWWPGGWNVCHDFSSTSIPLQLLYCISCLSLSAITSCL